MNMVQGCILLFAACLLFTGVGNAALFSEVHLLGYVWGKPDLTVRIIARPGAAHYLNDVLTVIDEWNAMLREVPGAPAMMTGDEPNADITVTIKPEEGVHLGYASLKTALVRSCVLDKVNIVLYSKASGTWYSHSGMRNIFRHEMAHAFGLGHSNDEKEQMFPFMERNVFFGDEDITPSDCEIKGLKILYPVRPYCDFPSYKYSCF